jgi:hypothetical protein
VDSVVGFEPGQKIQVSLDTGNIFWVIVAAISGFSIALVTGLPGSVGGQIGSPIENQVLLISPAPALAVFMLDVVGHDVLDGNVLT